MHFLLYFIYLKGSHWGLGYSDDSLLEELQRKNVQGLVWTERILEPRLLNRSVSGVSAAVLG